MLPEKTTGFELDHRLEGDSRPVVQLGLCDLRLRDDSRWPWLILVPQRPGAEEIHDLTPLDQAVLTFETNLVSKTLKEVTSCTKINCGTLGNVVRQLHVHIVARFEGDTGWPGPVWGHGTPVPYRRGEMRRFAEKLCEHL